jgi:hypothetical protein
MILNQRGVLHIPFLLMTLTTTAAGLGLWGLLHDWKSRMDTQLRLDHCTGEIALELKSRLKIVAAENVAISITRAAIVAASSNYVTASSVPALEMTLHLEVAHQELQRTLWLIRQVKWIAQRGCGQKGDSALPLPTLSWKRPPPDTTGEQALDLDELPARFSFAAFHLPRISASTVERKSDANAIARSLGHRQWHVRWVSPVELLRTGSR